MRIIEKKLYKIEEHPNQKAVYEWINNNWFNLMDFSIGELIDSIIALSNYIGGRYNYRIGTYFDGCDNISFFDYDSQKLNELNGDEYPLTGVFWDKKLIENLKNDSLEQVIKLVYDETNYIYSDAGLFDLCQANDYEFYINGKAYQGE